MLMSSIGGAGSPQQQQERTDIAMADVEGTVGPPVKKKQKRNKPTLSCVECVERKTKVRSVCQFRILNFEQKQRNSSDAVLHRTIARLTDFFAV